jgi:hypothetical protein
MTSATLFDSMHKPAKGSSAAFLTILALIIAIGLIYTGVQDRLPAHQAMAEDDRDPTGTAGDHAGEEEPHQAGR